MFKVLKSIALVIFVALIAQFILAQSQKIDRQKIGIADVQEEPDCSRLEPPNLWGLYNGKLDINRELVANDFAFYTAIAHDAYMNCGDATECTTHAYYRYERLTTPWRIVSASSLAAPNGFRAIVFEHSDDQFLRVIVALRGTDGLDLRDYWYGNFSWLTQWILPDNQYAAARSLMRDVVSEATARARKAGKKVCFIAVGHSLGGGLAQHIAYGFPNTAAVVIDSSPVINHFRFSEPFDEARVFHIHERGDFLSWAYEKIVGRYTSNNVHYPMNLIELDCEKIKGFWHGLCRAEFFVYKNHDTLAVSEGMAGMTLRCRLQTEGCELGSKRPVSVVTLQLGCVARRNGSKLDVCKDYEQKFGPIPKGI